MEETLGKRIVANRKRIGLTQDQLADRLGVTAQAVSKWENDQSCPDIATLPKLADIFGITLDALLGRSASHAVCGEVVEDEDNDKKGNHRKEWIFQWESGRIEAITFSVLVLLVGTLTLLSKLYTWDVSFWNILWPSALLVYGIKCLCFRFSFFQLGCALFGGYFLGENLKLWHLEMGSELIFPIIIVIIGLSLLMDALRKPKTPRITFHHDGKNGKTESSFHEEDETFECSLSFGECSRHISLPRLSGGDATVNFGELTVILTSCKEFADDCTIDATCSFGELVLILPRHCRAITESESSMGSFETEGHPYPDASDTVYINGRSSFGSIVVRYE